MSRIERTFASLDCRAAFIPFLAGGDPDLDTSIELIRVVANAGADIVEVGIPFSDPLADGPVIQRAFHRSLTGGLKLKALFARFAALRASGFETPLVAMLSWQLIHRRGLESFLARASDSGLDGLIVPDLPLEESSGLRAACESRGLDLVQLVAPSTPRTRAIELARASRGFLYCISRAGTTGERDRLPADLAKRLRELKQVSPVPVGVGFGISTPEQARQAAVEADAVIVGSALVRLIEDGLSDPQAKMLAAVSSKAETLRSAIGTARAVS